jgi:hypothetical protein
MRTNTDVRTAFAVYPAGLILLSAHCVCLPPPCGIGQTVVFLWSEKTTVCRIFNCKRASLDPGEYRPSESSAARGASPGPPGSLHSLAASTARSVPLAGTFYFTPTGCRSQPERYESEARRGRWAPAERKCRRHLQTNQSGEYRARTGDLLVANQALSQLS